MKNLKLGILACGALLLVLMLSEHFVDFLKADTLNAILMLVAYGVPTAMGALGITKPPFLQWQAIVSTAGFGLAAVKTRLWETLPHIMDVPGARLKIAILAEVVGLVLSIIAIVKPEPAKTA